MTFSKDLARLREEHPLFSNHYLDYNALKDAVSDLDVAKVMSLLRRELDKVNDIVEVEWEALSGELKVRLRGASEKPTEAIDAQSMGNLSQAVIRLHAFVEANYLGFQKIMQKCTSRQETASCSWFLARVEAAPFRQRSFDELLVPLGRLYTSLRRQRGAGSQAALHGLEEQAMPPAGEGGSQVFFLPAEQVMRAKVALLQHLEPAATISKVKTTSGTRDTSKVKSDFSYKLTHVYFEGPQGSQYAERLKRRVGGFTAASGMMGILLRCSLAGTEDDLKDPTHEVQVDVQDSEGQTSTFSLPQKAMPTLLAGTTDPKVGGGGAAEAVAEAINMDGLRPAVSASFLRSSFIADGPQSSASQAGPVMVSIDEHMTFRDEAALADTKVWCSAAGQGPSGTLPKVDFPGAILRVWLPASSATSLLGLVGLSGFGLQVVPGFSEALHGTALLHRELADPLPPWIPTETLVPMQQRSSLLAEHARPAAAAASSAAAAPSKKEAKPAEAKPKVAPAGQQPAVKAAAKPDVKLLVDCKTPMAIERTLLRWMRSTVLLAGLASYLIAGNTSSMQLSGILIGLLSLVFVVMPLRSYLERSKELQNPNAKQPRVDRTMPRTLALSLSVILLATIVLDVCGGVSAEASPES